MDDGVFWGPSPGEKMSTNRRRERDSGGKISSAINLRRDHHAIGITDQAPRDSSFTYYVRSSLVNGECAAPAYSGDLFRVLENLMPRAFP